jgi:uncharacterized membrane protein (DUF485 family)
MYDIPQYSGPQQSDTPKDGPKPDDPLAGGPRKPLPARIRPGNPRPGSPSPRNALEETGQMPALFARERVKYEPPPAVVPDGPDYAAIQRSAAFTDLRTKLRSFIFPMSLLFFGWYLTYVLLAAYAHDFMSRKVFGEVNVAILLGLGQFVTTILITVAYLKFARKHVDPQVALIREQSGAATR